MKKAFRWGCLFVMGCLVGFVASFGACRYILHLIRRGY
jgi:hypothetical protein